MEMTGILVGKLEHSGLGLTPIWKSHLDPDIVNTQSVHILTLSHCISPYVIHLDPTMYLGHYKISTDRDDRRTFLG